MTFKEAQQKVADRHGFSCWGALQLSTPYHAGLESIDEEAAHIFANEAVREDREKIAKEMDWCELEYKGNVVEHQIFFDSFPLPYPEKP